MPTKQLKTAIFCVTYHTYGELSDYYRSVCRAAERAQGKMKVDFFVADNSEREIQDISLPSTQNVRPKVFPFHENAGYLGAVQKMMQAIGADQLEQYDYAAISNVDLVMEEDALLCLSEIPLTCQAGWLAPALLSEQEGRDRNPAVMNRYSARRLRLLRLMFRYPLLVAAYRATAYKRHRAPRQAEEGTECYAGHGSFMLLTSNYFRLCGIPRFPMFLFGEELYLAEQCRLHRLSVVYCPSVRIRDREHASVSKIPSADKCRYNRESLGYILQTFY